MKTCQAYSTAREPQRCEMCGSLKTADECGRADSGRLAVQMEQVRRLAEWFLWLNMTNKGCGSLVKVLCAVLVNPCASRRQIAAVLGMTEGAVRLIEKRIKRERPEIHAALWPGAGA